MTQRMSGVAQTARMQLEIVRCHVDCMHKLTFSLWSCRTRNDVDRILRFIPAAAAVVFVISFHFVLVNVRKNTRT